MRNINYSVIAVTLLSLPLSSYAAADSTSPEYVAVSAYLGSRISNDLETDGEQDIKISNDSAQAIAVNWYFARNQETELFFSNSKHSMLVNNETENTSTDIYFSYLHFGGKLLFGEGPFTTSIGLGLGATFFIPDDSKYDKDIALSGNINAGIRYELNPQWALRGDIRLYGTVLNSNNSFFCSNEGCLVKLKGDVYVETELMAGIEYKF
ncbi:MAG: outer membrane beta-barrel protein [Psychromonas sp.]